MDARIVRIGNSKGIRLPKRILAKYELEGLVAVDELPAGILIRRKDDPQLSWQATYKAMANSDEDWSDWADLDLDDAE